MKIEIGRRALAEGAMEIASQFLRFVLRVGTKHSLAINLHFVAEHGELHPDSAVMAAMCFKSSHLGSST
jgi:hypothetical protein